MHSLRILLILGITLIIMLRMQTTFSDPNSPLQLNISSSVSPTPSPTTERVNNKRTFQLPFVYPNSVIKNFTQDDLVLESVDDFDRIVKWYEEILSKIHVENKSVIKNNSNNFFQYEISGNVQNYILSIKIEKKNEEKRTKITISVKSS